MEHNQGKPSGRHYKQTLIKGDTEVPWNIPYLVLTKGHVVNKTIYYKLDNQGAYSVGNLGSILGLTIRGAFSDNNGHL